MSNNSGGGGLILAGLAALLFMGLASSSSREIRTPVLPLPNPRRLPSAFVPVRGPRRISESSAVVIEQNGGARFEAKVYEPPYIPAPWTVRAWFDSRRSAHVIDIHAHPVLVKEDALNVKVFYDTEHNTNREKFRHGKEPLWPDDKFENRIVHRVKNRDEGVFLIEIKAGDAKLDFFHEPALDTAVIENDETLVKRHFSALEKLAEVEKVYKFEMEKLAQRTDLSQDMKVLMEAHLGRMYEDAVQEITDGS